MRSKMGRAAICLAGFVLLLLFQNFTYDKDTNVKNAIFGNGKSALKATSALTALPSSQTERRGIAEARSPEDVRLHGLALQASAYADFVGVEDVRQMTDAQILSRVSDSMFTSVEVMKMENTRSGKVKSIEGIARSLEKDSELQRMVIAAVRESATTSR